ncbi:MAG: MBL fold metallo-hydrolase [Anaerolineae bacterium]|nr:MBL fold metallo-hydrolase [Anaerolineae bacterium]
MLDRIEWLGYASFRLMGDPIIYIDPWRITRPDHVADVILISHDHFDHCSPADVAKVCGERSQIIASRTAAAHFENAVSARPWQVFNIGRASIRTVPAYNAAHPQPLENLGFIISVERYDLYYVGDSGVIPEMAKLRPDIVILPIGGNHTMTLSAALEAVRLLRPRYVIPSHWGSSHDGSTYLEVQAFAQRAGDLTQVIIPQQVR